ncbi:LLM class flavin-dependent oxidoreductase [Streptomyces sp. NPDC093984]|uniref:LLM class flavin-dependent oxidoreductase n=1 Tax=Streptomyces sp. NPDC093984 TaxID=3366052 RepID=UPI00382F17F9
MTSSHGRGLLHLAAAVDQREARDVDRHVEAVRLAERGALDFVTLGDHSAWPGPHGFGAPVPDALAVLHRAAPATRRIGLVPGTSAEPSRVRAALETLDRVSGGRAGWYLDLPATEAETRLREGWEDSGSPQGHPVRVVDATDAGTRTNVARHADVALARVTSPAQAAAVRDELRDAARESGREPDAVRLLASLVVDLGDGEHAAEPGWGSPLFERSRELGGGGGGPRKTAHGPLYRGGPVDLAELIAHWHTAGVVDGFHLTPAEPRRDLERLVNGTVALLQHRGLFRTFYPGSTLREHLGLPRPAHRHVVTGGTS